MFAFIRLQMLIDHNNLIRQKVLIGVSGLPFWSFHFPSLKFSPYLTKCILPFFFLMVACMSISPIRLLDSAIPHSQKHCFAISDYKRIARCCEIVPSCHYSFETQWEVNEKVYGAPNYNLCYKIIVLPVKTNSDEVLEL